MSRALTSPSARVKTGGAPRKACAKRRLIQALDTHEVLHPVSLLTPEIYSDVFDRLERRHVHYVTIGGVAVVLQGFIRPISDLDIVVSPHPEERQSALSSLNDCGFMASIPLPPSLLTMLRMFDQAQREVDVFVRYPIPFEELWASSRQVWVGNSVTRVQSLEHLLQVKRAVRRAQDLLDIEGLLACASGASK
jgi:hypothetical protein